MADMGNGESSFWGQLRGKRVLESGQQRLEEVSGRQPKDSGVREWEPAGKW